MSAKKRILVIGAGVSGLTAIKACKEEGLDVVCYEKSGDFGGLWRYRENNDHGTTSVMKFTISNSSKEMSSFSDFPPPESFPMYLPHVHVLKYLEMYGQQFDLFGCIRYCEEVSEILPAEEYATNGQLLVKVRNVNSEATREEIFDGVMVCSGHHGCPNMPPYPGLDVFTGHVSHSHDYKNYEGFEDKTVLVVGAGNSGTDIAVDLTTVAKQVYLSSRRGTWIFPRTLDKGKPIDVVLNRRFLHMQPGSYVENKVQKMVNSEMNHEKFGLKPQHSIYHQHPTINDELRSRLVCGAVLVRRDVKEFTDSGVVFENEDNTTNIDVVVFSTGYNLNFPFLGEDMVKVGKNNKVRLYESMFPPQLKHPSLAIIGLIQPHASLFPVFEMQSRYFVALNAGHCHLPSSEEMASSALKLEDFRAKNFVQSARHAIELDWPSYMDSLAEKIGVKPNLAAMLFKDPKMYRACVMGPMLPYQYRLRGPHKWRGAKDAILNYKSRMYGWAKQNKK